MKSARFGQKANVACELVCILGDLVFFSGLCKQLNKYGSMTLTPAFEVIALYVWVNLLDGLVLLWNPLRLSGSEYVLDDVNVRNDAK